MIKASFKKELLLLSRDVHALGVLFFMPLTFLIIMSLAMPDTSSLEKAPQIKTGIYSPVDSAYTFRLKSYISERLPNVTEVAENNPEQAKAFFSQSNLDAMIILPRQEDSQELLETETQIYLKPNISTQQASPVLASIQQQLGRARLFQFIQSMNGANTPEMLEQTQQEVDRTTSYDQLTTHYLSEDNQALRTPTSVQQSVPAWLVFGMFFVLIPLSATIIIERQQGTLKRLQSMNVSGMAYLSGKLLPYFLIHQCQMILMILSGFYLVPLLGGDALEITGSSLHMIIVSFATSFAALGFGLLIAMIAQTTEQATAIGGASNIILAAIGGIMIPKFVMPEAMQVFANISPMSWALDAYLAIILQGSAYGWIPYTFMLTAFGIVCFIFAVYRFKRVSLHHG